MLKGFYAIGILAADVISYSAKSIVTGKAIPMAVNSLGGLAYKNDSAIITLTIKAEDNTEFNIIYRAIRSELTWMGVK